MKIEKTQPQPNSSLRFKTAHSVFIFFKNGGEVPPPQRVGSVSPPWVLFIVRDYLLSS